MRKKFLFTFLFGFLFFLNCAGTSGGLKTLSDPAPNTVMVLGVVLIENVSMEKSFRNWDLPMEVILIGREENGSINHYTVKTDDKGYYCLPNLPKGSYNLKAVQFQEPGQPFDIIVNDWDNAYSTFYLKRHPERGIEYTADWFAKESTSRIINMGIIWFGLKSSEIRDMSTLSIGELMVSRFEKALKSERLWRDGYPYTREEPLTFFQRKFPDSRWWNLENQE